MKINFIGDISAIEEGLKLLQSDLDFSLEKGEREVKVEKREKGFFVSVNENDAIISYNTPADFYRALSLTVHAIKTESCVEISQTPAFNTLGIMFDVSRGAVLKVEVIKEYLRRMARMGFNEVMLYSEDIYELKEYPYFGYMRGRYSEEELKEIVEYASLLGIEAVPCIQTLGHLAAPFRWSAFAGIKDQPAVLMIGEEESYRFIEEMIKTVRRVFSTDKIHIGMDEAHGVGLGRYLAKNGLRDRFTILSEHLNKVLEICRQYDFEPMMWSDMFFRLGTPDGGYYSAEAALPENIASLIPDGVSQVYWDYYNNNENFYTAMISEHKKMDCPVIFAGGVWVWSGPSANNRQTLESTIPALKVCREQGIDHVFATAWGDDGAECDVFEALYGFQLYAELSYNSENAEKDVDKMFEICNGFDPEILKLFDLDNFDVPTFSPDSPDFGELESYIVNTSKQALYQNPLIGFLDKNFALTDLSSHYAEILKKLESLPVPKELELIVSVHRQLLKVLVSKSDIGIRLKKAYDDKDGVMLGFLAKELRALADDITTLIQLRKKLWYKNNKPFGFENVLSRLATIEQYAIVAYERVEAYLSGEIDSIDELSEERLWYNGYERPHFMEYFSTRIMKALS